MSWKLTTGPGSPLGPSSPYQINKEDQTYKKAGGEWSRWCVGVDEEA